LNNLLVYATDEINQATIVACGEVGLGANANSSTTPTQTTTQSTNIQSTDMTTTQQTDMTAGTTTQTTQPGPDDALRTSSYGIFALEGSGIDGKLQLQETAEKGVRATLTLSGIVAGSYYDATLFSGDCSPNQPEVLALEPVGESVPEDPFASITITEMSYDALTSGNLFVMVFDQVGGAALACGEVGVGANR
jgi:hypothetical protein